MVASKFGKADPDMRSRKGSRGKTKEISDKPMLKASTKTPTTGMIGGQANNQPVSSDARKGSAR